MAKSTQKLDESFFAQFKKTHLYKKNKLIIGPAAEPSGVFYIKSGFVRLYIISNSGKEITFNIFKPGTCFSMMWVLNDTPNIYYFEGITDVLILEAPKSEVVKFIESNPKVLYDLTKRTLSGLDGMTRLMHSLLTGNAYQNIASVLLVLTRRFGKKKNNKEYIINIPLTHRIIGTLAGLSRESTSLELAKLAKNKIIFQKNHLILVKNLKKLESESSINFEENIID
jgi:CRP/FNR family transcriptional regulator